MAHNSPFFHLSQLIFSLKTKDPKAIESFLKQFYKPIFENPIICRDSQNIIVTGGDSEGNFELNENAIYLKIKEESYVLDFFDFLENLYRSEIASKIYKFSDVESIAVYLTSLQIELGLIIKDLEKLQEDDFEKPAAVEILKRINNYHTDLKKNNLKRIVQKNDTPKIKWLGNINLLATLLYELLEGQKSTEIKNGNKIVTKTSPLISIEDDKSMMILKNLITENFVKSDGTPIDTETIGKYFRDENKLAKKGKRITLP